jgi:Zn finger protein HypA/HybF involved in hydrogenase expression
MPVLAGEGAPEEGNFRCQKCSRELRLSKGRQVPKCENCGHDIYDFVDRAH